MSITCANDTDGDGDCHLCHRKGGCFFAAKPSPPRLRCREQSSNHFYGSYRGHQVMMERDHKSCRWTYLVIAPDGLRCADGIMRDPGELRAAIEHALRGALLWPWAT